MHQDVKTPRKKIGNCDLFQYPFVVLENYFSTRRSFNQKSNTCAGEGVTLLTAFRKHLYLDEPGKFHQLKTLYH